MSCQVTFLFRELHPDLVIIAADEAGCYFDMPANKTLEKKGTKFYHGCRTILYSFTV